MNAELLAFHYCYPISWKRWHKLLYHIQSAENLLSIPPKELSLYSQIPMEHIHSLMKNYRAVLQIPLETYYRKKGIIPITYTNPLYPKQLLQLHQPPLVLYCKGNLQLLTGMQLAVVGSRKATSYTKRALELLLPPLIAQHATIVSGLAQGADRMAHETAIKFGGATIGVIAHGFEHIYPQQNATLFRKMYESQLVITEYPPHMRAQKWHFPMRNRIISGLSDALLVTEAAKKSGTLITTDIALELGKDIFVVPGPIDAEQSQGTNQLIKDGAFIATNGYEIIEHLSRNY